MSSPTETTVAEIATTHAFIAVEDREKKSPKSRSRSLTRNGRLENQQKQPFQPSNRVGQHGPRLSGGGSGSGIGVGLLVENK